MAAARLAASGVLDLCQVLSGPLCGTLVAARVVCLLALLTGSGCAPAPAPVPAPEPVPAPAAAVALPGCVLWVHRCRSCLSLPLVSSGRLPQWRTRASTFRWSGGSGRSAGASSCLHASRLAGWCLTPYTLPCGTQACDNSPQQCLATVAGTGFMKDGQGSTHVALHAVLPAARCGCRCDALSTH